MLDIQVSAYPARPPYSSIEFLRIELVPLAGGHVAVQMTATTVDEHVPQLLDQEVASEKVSSIDDVLSLIRTRVAFVPRLNSKEQ
ncbi:MAG: hypothetical protein KGZ73_05100 [Rhizobiales bacterium]|nr:hypothetical protein [Hyphomicrobiales bacterium]